MKIRVKIEGTGKSAAGMRIPDEVVAALSASRKPAVKATINGYTYRSSIASMGGEFWLGASNDVRAKAGVAAGDEVDLELEIDTEPRVLELPEDLAAALAANLKAKEAYEKLSYSNQRRHVEPIMAIKSAETRARRIKKFVQELAN